ncbi:nucleotidyltransferase domain-containing protein [Candidatus Pacearchaeota archaeon]|nr:nucleotidyltransferase domain-containing protein [Candidatus Pacearchaeota archaeon]
MIQKLRNILKDKIKENVADIFIIGSALKDNLFPRDFDIIVLFKEKNLKEVEEELFKIKESISFVKNVHIEPLFLENMFEEKIFLSLLHEGFSIKTGKFLPELMKLKSYSIFSYNLENLDKTDKVRFAQALYGRKKDGLLYQEKGISLGQGSFFAPVEREEIFKELMKRWKIKYTRKRAFVSD